MEWATLHLGKKLLRVFKNTGNILNVSKIFYIIEDEIPYFGVY